MRHGRKSKSKRFNGYKRHVAADIDTDLILACTVTPANRPEQQAASQLQADIAALSLVRPVGELHVDRGYINSPVADDIIKDRGEVVCRPWVPHNDKLFTKRNFTINMRDRTITCPAGKTEQFTTGTVVEFNPRKCARCALRFLCTTAANGAGRTVNIAENEQLQHRLRKLTAGPSGRARLRERVAIEHRLAHITQRQGRRARYSACAKTCLTCAAAPPFSTSRQFTESRPPLDFRRGQTGRRSRRSHSRPFKNAAHRHCNSRR